jgi:serine/threonine-protein kinase
MRTIRLNLSQWRVDERELLGPAGGFGAVFRGASESGAPAAIKRLHPRASDFAGRELDMAERLVSRSFNFVLPILDYGQDAESDEYFVVMPLADKSFAG